MKVDESSLSQIWSTQDLAAIIQEDASDTYNKFAETFAAFSVLETLQDYGSLSYAERMLFNTSAETKAMFDQLYDYLINDCNNKITITMSDGDILWFETYEDIDPQDPEASIKWIRAVHNVYEGGEYIGTAEDYICQWHSERGFSFNGQHVHDLSGEYEWNLTEILSSIAESMNSSLLYTRLCTLVQQGTVTISDISACVQDITLAAGGQAQTLVECLKDLGTNLNSATILRMIQQTYKSMATTTVESGSDTIEWNDYDYSVTGYAGTVIKNAFVGAAQVIGGILVYGGAVVLKVAGALIMLAGVVVNALWTTVEYVAGEKAKYNPLADTKEFPMPIWQENITAPYNRSMLHNYGLSDSTTFNDIDRMITYLYPEIEDGYVIKLVTPAVNFYFWSHDGFDIYCEAYLTTSFKGVPLATQTFGKATVVTTDDLNINAVTEYWQRTHLEDSGTKALWHWDGELNILTDDLLDSIYSNENLLVTNSPTLLSQDGCKQALENALYLCSLLLYSSIYSSRIGVTPRPDHGVNLNAVHQGYYGKDCSWIFNTFTWTENVRPGEVRPPSSEDYITVTSDSNTKYQDALFNLLKYITVRNKNTILHSTVTGDEWFRILSTSTIHRSSWTELCNTLLPSLKYIGFENILAQSLGRLMPKEPVTIYDVTENFYAAYYWNTRSVNQLQTYGNSLILPSTFRQDYEIFPPSVEPGTTLKVVLITASIVTAVTIAAVVTRFAVKKKLRNIMSSKYAQIESLHNQFVSDHSEDTLKEFNTAVRKYNFIAGLAGYSSLSYVNGWEAGDGSSAVETVGAAPQAVNDIVSTVSNSASETITAVADGTRQQLTVAAQSIVSDVTGVDPTTPASDANINAIISLIRG